MLQPACSFEEPRTVCYKTYGLDCVQFYTASNLSGSACLKVCKPDLELLTDRNILDLTERMIRGGLESVYSSRLEIANNSLLSNFDESKKPSSILYIDANNLYGGVMLHYPLPLKDFEIVEEISLEDNLNTDDEGDIGYIVEVDLHYPDDLHDKHSDFPLISDKEPVDPIELSEYQSELKTALNVSNSKIKKLRQTCHSKMNYVTHYRILKFFISNGLKVNKLHRAVKF